MKYLKYLNTYLNTYIARFNMLMIRCALQYCNTDSQRNVRERLHPRFQLETTEKRKNMGDGQEGK